MSENEFKTEISYIHGDYAYKKYDTDGKCITGYEIGPATSTEIAEVAANTIIPTEYPIFSGALYSFITNQGQGLETWKKGELNFHRLQQGPYLEILIDMSKNYKGETNIFWTSRKLPYVIEYLKENNITVHTLWQGKIGNNLPAWLLLYI